MLEALQRKGFAIGIETHMDVVAVLRTLPPDAGRETLKTTLCPLFARNEDQQALFYSVFNKVWDAAHPAREPETEAAPEETDEAVKRGFLPPVQMAGMLLAYSSGWIKVTERLRSGIVAATGGIMIFYLASFVLGFFGISIPGVFDGGLIGIGFSLIVVGVAAFNLLLDFDLIDNLVLQGAPKHLEWYGAFGLIVTLVWLYLEILRLLAKLQSDD